MCLAFRNILYIGTQPMVYFINGKVMNMHRFYIYIHYTLRNGIEHYTATENLSKNDSMFVAF